MPYEWAGNINSPTKESLKQVTGIPAGDKWQIPQADLVLVNRMDLESDPMDVDDFVLEDLAEQYLIYCLGGTRIYRARFIEFETLDGEPPVEFLVNDAQDTLTINPLQTGYCSVEVFDLVGRLNRRLRYAGNTSSRIEDLEIWSLPEILDGEGNIQVDIAKATGETVTVFFPRGVSIPVPGVSIINVGGGLWEVTANVPGLFTIEFRTPRNRRGRNPSYKEVIRAFELTAT